MTEKLVSLPHGSRGTAGLGSIGGGGGGDHGRMDMRVTVLEQAIARIDAMLPTVATKSEIEAVRGDIKGWMLATVLALIGTMLAALFGVFQIVRTGPAPAANPPVIINNLPPPGSSPAR